MKRMIIAVLALLTINSAFAMTAFWTGRQVQVQTVTYRMAWKCEYQYAGQRFWMIFEGSCPSSIDVQ